MDLELEGKVAIVTGGSIGIGKAIALQLAWEGVDVAVCARRTGPLEEAAQEIARRSGRRAIPITADMTERPSVEQMVKTTVDTFGKVDILVNNAAAPGGLVQGTLADASEDALLQDINTKVMGYFRCAKAVAPHMQAQGWGRIINIGGLAARQAGTISGLRNLAVVHLTKTLSEQLGPDGITVNVVHPGATRTERTGPMQEEQARQQGITVEEVQRRAAQNNAIRRMVDTKEIAYLVAFLASPKAAAITGEAISAGGGAGRAVYP